MGSENITDCELLQGMPKLSNREMGSSTYLSQVSAYWHGASGQNWQKPTRSPRAFLICTISDRHYAIAVIVHGSGYYILTVGNNG